MAAMIPLGLMAASAIPGLIGGIMNIANEAKRLHGGKIKYRPYHHKKRGGKIKHKKYKKHIKYRGKGLSPMYISRPYTGMGFIPYHGYMGRQRIAGLLAPAGGMITHRKGHLRKIPGKKHRIRVKPSLVRGRGIVSDSLGMIPLVGPTLGNIAKMFGGRVKKPNHSQLMAMLHVMRKMRGMGLSPMYSARPYVGMGLSPYGKKRIGYGTKKYRKPRKYHYQKKKLYR